jgi:hypothetical protein
MNRRSITVVVVLCVVGLAYGHGWLHPSRTGDKLERYMVSAHEALDQQKVKVDAVRATRQTAEPELNNVQIKPGIELRSI